MDPLDKAAEYEAKHREWAIARQREQNQHTLMSAYECEECGEPIPEARRQAVTGCRCCIDCQQEMERYGQTRFTT